MSCSPYHGVWVSTMEPFDIQVLENIQYRTARWVCGGRWDPSVFFMDQIVRSMFTPVGMAIYTLPIFQLIYYMILLTTKLQVKLSDFCSFVSSHTRQHSLSIFPLQSTINSLQYSFFQKYTFHMEQNSI